MKPRFLSLLLAVALCAAAPVRAEATAATTQAAFTPRNATEAVLHSAGYVDASLEVATTLAAASPTQPGTISFRLIAVYQRTIILLLRSIGAPTEGIAYMQGRSDAYDAAADALGEPH